MEFIESTHAKSTRALVGARHSWYSHQYCLCFLFVVREIIMHLLLSNLVSHRGVLVCSPCTILLTYFQEFYGHICYWWLYPYVMWFLGVLIYAWFAWIKQMLCHIFKLTFDVFWWRLRSGSGTHPNSPLLWFDLVWHAIFFKSPNLLTYL